MSRNVFNPVRYYMPCAVCGTLMPWHNAKPAVAYCGQMYGRGRCCVYGVDLAADDEREERKAA